MNTHILRSCAAAALASACLLLSACGDSSTLPDVPVATAETSPAVAINLVQDVAATSDAQSDSSEPLAVPDTLAVDDSGEPRAVN
ncbi:hypothetical protein [Sphaerotilus mobilis]|uniref:Lipoprotein n=1 Tax=Sphaerotilus mobilis TaxID=47994 RepID=A0A4Q7LH35_9BURK|nr:hypothetical protein [Sphaerotilus mobilis]RZS53381.1 hypothetical protein EV685_3009 [Sphaerotilus mobilis]